MKKILNYVFVCILFATISSCSKNDQVGPSGEKGDRGEKGETGAQGIPGTDGQMLLYGNKPPTAADGKEGDFFIDKKNGSLYGPKENGSWGSAISLKGDTGPAGPSTNGKDGSQFHSGTSTPTTIGVISDFYFNTNTGQLYGPKTSSGWGAGVSLKGEKGDKGDRGPVGPKGDDGVDGNANVKKFSFYISSNDWGGGHFGDGNIHSTFKVTTDLTGGISIGSPDYLPLAYIAPVQEGGDTYSEKKALPYIMSMRVGAGEEEYGIRYELLPNRQYITMSKTTNGFNSLSIGSSRYPKKIHVTIILIKYSLMSKLKDQVDFNDLKAVSNYFNLK